MLRTKWILVALAACGLFSSLAASGPQAETDGSPIKAALDRALDDERHAEAFYEAVMARHGVRRPFSMIIEAERRHQTSLLQQYRRLGLDAPPNAWAGHGFEVPESFAEACDTAAVAEIRNGRLYDDLAEGVADAVVLKVFKSLHDASMERHLPAFQRHGSGWAAVEASSLSETQEAQRARADAARGEMFGALFAELTDAMTSGGPASAINVCAVRAPEIAAQTAAAHGVKIGRTSWKRRNPANTPPVWAELLVDDRASVPVFMADRSGRLGAFTPITLAAGCVQCHGEADALAEGVAARLTELYPDDRATGFAEGDLRGWFWVEVPAAVPSDRARTTSPRQP